MAGHPGGFRPSSEPGPPSPKGPGLSSRHAGCWLPPLENLTGPRATPAGGEEEELDTDALLRAASLVSPTALGSCWEWEVGLVVTPSWGGHIPGGEARLQCPVPTWPAAVGGRAQAPATAPWSQPGPHTGLLLFK